MADCFNTPSCTDHSPLPVFLQSSIIFEKSDWNNILPSGEVTLTSLNSAALFHVPSPMQPREWGLDCREHFQYLPAAQRFPGCWQTSAERSNSGRPYHRWLSKLIRLIGHARWFALQKSGAYDPITTISEFRSMPVIQAASPMAPRRFPFPVLLLLHIHQ